MSPTPPERLAETQVLDENPPPERELWLWAVVLLVLALAGAAAVWLASRAGEGTETAPTAPAPALPARTVTVEVTRSTPAATQPASTLPAVPNLVGLDEKTARRLLHDAGFKAEFDHQATNDPAMDKVVLAVQPAAGTPVQPGSEVTVFVGKLEGGEGNGHHSD
jgi:PASTA domain